MSLLGHVAAIAGNTSMLLHMELLKPFQRYYREPKKVGCMTLTMSVLRVICYQYART